jgi:hypothetical protein
MTIEVLRRLQRDHAFDPSPLREDLGVYHVPFEEAVSGLPVESELDRAVRVPERVALSGPSGSGKSSVMSFVLGPLAEGVAPIRVPVAVESEEVATEPEAFAAHLIRTVARYAENARELSARDRETFEAATAARRPVGGKARGASLRLAPHWLLTGPELALEVRSASEPAHIGRSGTETIEQARAVLEVIRARELLPVLMIDDSDAWLQVVGIPDRTPIIAGFFSRVVRMIAEELPAALVVAVHDSYLGMEAFARAAGFIETTVRLPALPHAKAMGMLLTRRIQAHTRAALGRVFDGEAVVELFRYYAEVAKGNLRQVMLVAHTALRNATTAGLDTISSPGLTAAIAECEPGSST